jgi:hypothetical protein
MNWKREDLRDPTKEILVAVGRHPFGVRTAGMAAWYARDAQLERKLAGVVEAIDEQLSNKTV